MTSSGDVGSGLGGSVARIIDDDGWMAGARRVPSPNRDQRPGAADGSAIGNAPTLIVVHNISLPPGVFGGRAVEQLFTNALDCDADPFYRTLIGLEVSAHLLIRRTGEVVQFVPFGLRAWHAGISSFEGRERVNDFSIGIELEGDDVTPFEDAQYAALVGAIDALARHYPIDAVTGHSDIAPDRKTDPGPCFDWSRVRGSLRDRGVTVSTTGPESGACA